MSVQVIPDGYSAVTPVFNVDGAAKFIDFVTNVFGGKERLRMPMPDGTIAHAEIEIGDGIVMISDPMPDYSARPGAVHLYVEDVDATYAKAVAAGATSVMAPENQFYGDRSANVVDPWGNRWSIATHVEDVPEDEMVRRMEEYTAQAGAGS